MDIMEATLPETDERNRHPYHRHFLRKKIRLKVQVRLRQSFQAWTHNISEGGACFEISEQLAVRREVQLWIYLKPANEEPPVAVVSRIVWVDAGRKGFRHGAELLTFAEDGLLRLRTYLASL